MSARRLPAAALGVLILFLLAACGEERSIPAVDLQLRIEVEADTIALGRAFPLRVERIWSKTLEPEAWEDAFLSPLQLELLEARRDEDATRIRESRRYLAYAFSLKDVVIPALPFRATPKDGSKPRLVKARGLRLPVLRQLDPLTPGVPELPAAAPPARSPLLPWIIVAGILGGAFSLGVVLRRYKAEVPPPESVEPPQPKPHELALEALAALRARAGTSPEERLDGTVQLADLLRDYVGRRFEMSTREMTTEELLASSHLSLEPPHRTALSALLARCDLAKFADQAPSAEAWRTLLQNAEAFVQEGVSA